MSQDSPYAPTPDYGSAPPAAASARDEMTAPAQMGPLARLGNVVFAPGDVFEDVRRSPRDWWLPMVLLIVFSAVAGVVIQQRLHFTPEAMAQAATEANLERQGKSEKDLSDQERQQLEQGKKFTEMIFKLGPALGVITIPFLFGVMSLVYWLVLLISQAKTTYFRVLSVVTYAYSVPNIVKLLLTILYAFLVSPDNVDAKSFLASGGLLTTSLAFVTSLKAHPVLWTALNWIDLFSIWFMVLCAIGFGAISLKRKTFGSAFLLVLAPYALLWLITIGFTAAFAK
jgi:hypothetical protein